MNPEDFFIPQGQRGRRLDDVSRMVDDQSQPGWTDSHPDVQRLMQMLDARAQQVNVPQGVRGRTASMNPTQPDDVDMMISEQMSPGWDAQHPAVQALIDALFAPGGS